MYTALKTDIAFAIQRLDGLSYNDRLQLNKLCVALCARLGICVPKYRTMRGTNKRTQDVSKVLQALYTNIDTCCAVQHIEMPTVRVSSLRYLFGLRKYRTKYNTDNLIKLIKETPGIGCSVSFADIMKIVGKGFAITSTHILSPEDRPYSFGHPEFFELWTQGLPVPIEHCIEYAHTQLQQILK